MEFDINELGHQSLQNSDIKQEIKSCNLLLNQGAEAKLYLYSFLGKVCVVKERFEKKYRVKELDQKITKERILNESRNIARAYKSGINTPHLLFVDLLNRKIYMQFVDNSAQLKEVLRLVYLNDHINHIRLIEKIYTQMGENLAKLHNSNIIHGDLTTSNMLLKLNNSISYNQLDASLINASRDEIDKFLNSGLDGIISNSDFDYFYLIDFGLSYVSAPIEDKAVDLYVLKKAMISVNPQTEEIFDKMLEVYAHTANKGDKITEHLKKVEMRGRKKVAFG